VENRLNEFVLDSSALLYIHPGDLLNLLHRILWAFPLPIPSRALIAIDPKHRQRRVAESRAPCRWNPEAVRVPDFGYPKQGWPTLYGVFDVVMTTMVAEWAWAWITTLEAWPEGRPACCLLLSFRHPASGTRLSVGISYIS